MLCSLWQANEVDKRKTWPFLGLFSISPMPFIATMGSSMKTLFLAGVAVLFLATGAAHARNSDWSDQMVGEGRYLTCDKFNKLSGAKKDKALEWAFGYVSGMAT